MARVRLSTLTGLLSCLSSSTSLAISLLPITAASSSQATGKSKLSKEKTLCKIRAWYLYQMVIQILVRTSTIGQGAIFGYIESSHKLDFLSSKRSFFFQTRFETSAPIILHVHEKRTNCQTEQKLSKSNKHINRQKDKQRMKMT